MWRGPPEHSRWPVEPELPEIDQQSPGIFLLTNMEGAGSVVGELFLEGVGSVGVWSLRHQENAAAAGFGHCRAISSKFPLV